MDRLREAWRVTSGRSFTSLASRGSRRLLAFSVRYWETGMKRLLVFSILGLVVLHLSAAYAQVAKSDGKTMPRQGIAGQAGGKNVGKHPGAKVDGISNPGSFLVSFDSTSLSIFPAGTCRGAGKLLQNNTQLNRSDSTHPRLLPNAKAQRLVELSADTSILDTSINRLGLEWIWVEGGTFRMGCTEEQSNCYENEKPVHEVYLDGFYMSKYEVTVAQFAQFVKETGYQTDAEKAGFSWILVEGKWKTGRGINWRYNGRNEIRPEGEYNHPVIHVSWNDASAFCKWLSKKIGTAVGLPTEAEWEYAARGGQKSRGFKFSGSNDPDAVAWYCLNADGNTHPVGQKQPNELGLYDMSGNVYEWCLDWYDPTYYSRSPYKNPTGPSSGFFRVVRGGAWSNCEEELRVSIRTLGRMKTTNSAFGFRIRKKR